MPTTMLNQARLQFTYGATTATAASNIASTIIQGPLSAGKSALEAEYRSGDALTYIVTIANTGTNALAPVSVTADLGAYAVNETLTVTPMDYIGPAQLYINGAFSATLTPQIAENAVTFVIPSLPAGANAMIIYNTKINEYAMLDVLSTITNTATVYSPTLTEEVTVTATVQIAAYADVVVNKSMTPNPVTDGSLLTSTFLIQNFGNTDATSVVLTDTFTPAPDPVTVTVDGAVLSDADYDYIGGALTLPGAASTYALTIPAATFAQDETTGEMAINPGSVTITVVGTI